MTHELNLHHYSLPSAISEFVNVFNAHIAARRKGRIVVIHGASTVGSGHSIGDSIRRLLDQAGVEYVIGGNAGRTIVIPGGSPLRWPSLVGEAGKVAPGTSCSDSNEETKRIQIYKHIRKMCSELGKDLDTARRDVASLYRVSINAVKRILREGTAKGW